MGILFENKLRNPKLSIVLMDWSVRESFHTIDYLNDQTVTREDYELLWIEYFGRRAGEIDKRLRECNSLSKPPAIDVWASLDMPQTVYPHRHLMQNVALSLARGQIVCYADSDAVMRPTFAESVLESFREHKGIVLHIDQVRSNDRSFYPFNYPTPEQIEQTAHNMLAGKPFGLVCTIDPIHSLNYGACMCALRNDLLSIGGSDEQLDYLGYINGFYEMTLRLVNAGKHRVFWHPTEWFYHTWHPGQAGIGNYMGPNDGRNMSSTALDIRRTGRVMPERENPAVKKLRHEPNLDSDSESILTLALAEVNVDEWSIANVDKDYSPYTQQEDSPRSKFYALKILLHPLRYARLLVQFIRIFTGQIAAQRHVIKPSASLGFMEVVNVIRGLWNHTVRYRPYLMSVVRQRLRQLEAEGTREVALWGAGEMAIIFYIISAEFDVRITGVYGDNHRKKFLGITPRPLEALSGYDGKVVIAENVDIGSDTVMRLREVGVRSDYIMLVI